MAGFGELRGFCLVPILIIFQGERDGPSRPRGHGLRIHTFLRMSLA